MEGAIKQCAIQEMKTSDKIPTGKLNRAGKILKTGLKVGKNYATHYGAKLLQVDVDKDDLDEKNAADIMDSLLELKGSGLKVAQMLSMEKSFLPKAYVDQFSLAQFSVPALSVPLVKKTFRQYLGKNPEDLFDEFDYEASFAASIGQVHQATLDGQRLAVKIQYPGVAESISSDLAMLKPMASKLLRLEMDDAEKYFQEVEHKLLEETDYELELESSQKIAAACAIDESYIFPKYYPSLSSKRIITMDWVDGVHLPAYAASDIDQQQRDLVGQKIWDLFMYQIHELKFVHADPHPGNLLVTPEGKICMLDFGCMKKIPEEFFAPFMALTAPNSLDDAVALEGYLYELDMLLEEDGPDEKAFYFEQYYEVLSLFLRPYQNDNWDFSDKSFFDEITETGERIAKQTLLSKYKMNRGSEHFIYINRTFFGLYQLMHMLGAKISVQYPR